MCSINIIPSVTYWGEKDQIKLLINHQKMNISFSPQSKVRTQSDARHGQAKKQRQTCVSLKGLSVFFLFFFYRNSNRNLLFSITFFLIRSEWVYEFLLFTFYFLRAISIRLGLLIKGASVKQSSERKKTKSKEANLVQYISDHWKKTAHKSNITFFIVYYYWTR